MSHFHQETLNSGLTAWLISCVKLTAISGEATYKRSSVTDPKLDR